METIIIVTGILKSDNEFLIIKRRDDDESYPGAWEFPGGHLEKGETLKEGLKRELKEEIGFDNDFTPRIISYDDEVKNHHHIELNFLINVNKEDLNVILSEEHSQYKWVSKDSNLLDDYIKSKIENI